MRQRHLSLQARRDFEAIVAQASLCAASQEHTQVTAQILGLVVQAHDQRETRTYELLQSVPGFIWITLLVLFLVQVVFLSFAGVEQPIHIILATLFCACTVLVLISIRLLDYPFEGALAITNNGFGELAHQIDELERAPLLPR